jgi:uncharacterized protein (UPF0261 family)
MNKTIAVLATLDTKGQESNYLREQIEKLGGSALLIDMGVVGEPGTRTDIGRGELAAAGGSSLEDILENPTRQDAAPVMVGGAIRGYLSLRRHQGYHHDVFGQRYSGTQ